MQAIPLVRSGALRPLIVFLDQLGVVPGRAVSAARPLLNDRDAVLPIPMAGALFEEAKCTVGDEAFGLALGNATPVLEFHEWGSVLRRAGTVASLLGSIGAAARRFNTGEQLWASQRGGDVWLHWRFSSRMIEGRPVVVDFALMLLLQAIRLAAGNDWRPDEIHIEGERPHYAERIAALARKRALFGRPCSAMVFPARVLAATYPTILAVGEAAMAPALAQDFEGSIRQLVASMRKVGALDLTVVADAVNMSERSLQRRLAQCGSSFARVVDDVRFDTARRMLEDPSRKIIEISAELGYSDSANFTRAFRRRAGVSPQAFRQAG